MSNGEDFRSCIFPKGCDFTSTKLRQDLNVLIYELSPQAAIDAPRICIGAVSKEEEGISTASVKEGIPEKTIDGLKLWGTILSYRTVYDRAMFGCGQLICCRYADGRTVCRAGCDPRGDGHVVLLQIDLLSIVLSFEVNVRYPAVS